MAKILYIEDVEDNVTFVERIVTSLGHDFMWAKNAGEGLGMADQARPDLILLDLGLPDADGQTLSVWLRENPSLEKIPIVVLTACPTRLPVPQWRRTTWMGIYASHSAWRTWCESWTLS